MPSVVFSNHQKYIPTHLKLSHNMCTIVVISDDAKVYIFVINSGNVELFFGTV